jgi:quinolinate synthase
MLGGHRLKTRPVPPIRIGDDETFLFAGGWEGAQTHLSSLSSAERDRLDKSRLLLWGSFCGVHTVFSAAQVRHWRERGYRVLVHPECTVDVVDAADGAGSTKYLWNALQQAKPGDKLAIGTEGNFVRNAQAYGRDHGINVVNLADIPGGDVPLNVES